MKEQSLNTINQQTTEIFYIWPDGREEVRYRRPTDSKEALQLISEIEIMRAKYKDCQYNWRNI